MLFSTINTYAVEIRRLDKYGKALMVKLSTNDERELVELWSYETLIATISAAENRAPALSINAEADDLTNTTLRHLRQFLGAKIEKRELLKHMRNVFYPLANRAEGFKMREIDGLGAGVEFAREGK